jgi:hypothetical protein
MTPRLAAASVLVLASFGCSASVAQAPAAKGFPNQIAFDDEVLELKAVWKREERSAASYARKEEKIPAPLQVGVIVSTSGENDEDLHNWVMDRYTSSLGLQQYHTETEANWACKVGLLPPLGAQPRPFIALHLCRQGARGTACAEVEEELEGIELTECINRPSCWRAKCEQRWDARSESVEAVVRNAVGER